MSPRQSFLAGAGADGVDELVLGALPEEEAAEADEAAGAASDFDAVVELDDPFALLSLLSDFAAPGFEEE